MERPEFNKVDVKSMVSLSIPWLIACAFGELSVYYMRFDVNLLGYFSASDIFPGILPELVTLILVIVIVIVLLFFTTLFINFDKYLRDEREATTRQERSHATAEPPWYIDLFIHHLPFGLGSALTLVVYITFLNNDGSNDLLKIFGAVVVMTLILTYIYSFAVKNIKLFRFSREINFINNCFITLFITSCMIGYIRSDLTKFNYYKGTSILINGKVKGRDTTYYVISDTNRYYIGKTSAYVIFYNSLKEAATLYPISEVKEINLQLKKPPIGLADTIPNSPGATGLPPDPTHPMHGPLP